MITEFWQHFLVLLYRYRFFLVLINWQSSRIILPVATFEVTIEGLSRNNHIYQSFGVYALQNKLFVFREYSKISHKWWVFNPVQRSQEVTSPPCLLPATWVCSVNSQTRNFCIPVLNSKSQSSGYVYNFFPKLVTMVVLTSLLLFVSFNFSTVIC